MVYDTVPSSGSCLSVEDPVMSNIQIIELLPLTAPFLLLGLYILAKKGNGYGLSGWLAPIQHR